MVSVAEVPTMVGALPKHRGVTAFDAATGDGDIELNKTAANPIPTKLRRIPTDSPMSDSCNRR
jgi:hypothetical protein